MSASKKKQIKTDAVDGLSPAVNSGVNRRQFMVSICGIMAGAFRLPFASGMTESNTTSETIRKLIAPVTRQRMGDGMGHMLIWMEKDDDGEIQVMKWWPQGPDEIEEARRFYEASHAYEKGPLAVEAREGVTGKVRRAVKKLVFPPAKRTPQEEQLLEAIRCDIDSPTPWLAYAKWLQASDPTRAQYIHAVWEQELHPADSPARNELAKRAETLMEQHAKEWLAPLAELGLEPNIGMDMYFPFLFLEKGAPVEIIIDKPGILPRRAKQFFDAAPLVTSLELELDEIDMPAFAKMPQLNQIRQLNIGVLIQSEEDLSALLNSKYLSNLRGLNLSYWGLTSEAMTAIVASPLLAQLESLDLTSCTLGNDAIELLMASPKISQCRRLVLYDNELSEPAARAIANSPHLGALRELNLGDNPLGGEGAAALAQAPFLRQLTQLSFHKCAIDSEGAESLGKARWPMMLDLNLSQNTLGPDGIAALLPALAKSRIKTLNLDRTELDAAGVKHLITLRGLRLESLNLSHNGVGDAGMTALAKWRDFPPLKYLELIENGIGDPGAKALAASPLLAGLSSLQLSNNPIGNAGAKALAASPHVGPSLTLYLSKSVGEPGREALAKRFGEYRVSYT